MLADDPNEVQAASAVGSDEPLSACVPGQWDAGLGSHSGLSTDYLNHYSEILMLIEMASEDESIVAEIAGWQPIGYREYFLKSPLRHAASALAAYDRLGTEPRAAFARQMEALDKLTQAAILALQPPCHRQNVLLIAEAIGPAIRRQIDRAAAFLNSGRCVPRESDDTQAIIDRLIA
jgi:hypothetical protein